MCIRDRNKGYQKALGEDKNFLAGLNVCKGQVTYKAVADVFGHHADKIMISSTKSMHGHIIGGTGAVELIACILALRDGVISPTIGYVEHDPECALDVVPNEARDAKVKLAISNAFAFGGLNAVLVLQKV